MTWPTSFLLRFVVTNDPSFAKQLHSFGSLSFTAKNRVMLVTPILISASSLMLTTTARVVSNKQLSQHSVFCAHSL